MNEYSLAKVQLIIRLLYNYVGKDTKKILSKQIIC